jgi:pseudouridine-5'-phosphate glycosidase
VPVPKAPVRLTEDIAAALRGGDPLVALESSVLAQGLPIPANRGAARAMLDAVRAQGATPAITAVVRGVPTLGLEPDELERFLRRDGVRKVSARDLPAAMVAGADGATTVAASLALARLAGIDVFATGGIGGVHREPAFDESADLPELARTPIVVVCTGAKSILDLPATVERLETLGIPIVGYRTSELPGFFTVGTGIALTSRADSAAELADMFRAHLALARPTAMLVVQPPPADVALSQQVVDVAVTHALTRARDEGVRGAAVTPYLLAEVERATGGRSLAANLALLEANAALAGRIAAELRGRKSVAEQARERAWTTSDAPA